MDSPLPHSVEVTLASGRSVTVGIKYPWRPVKCQSCKVFGHSDCSWQVIGGKTGEAAGVVNMAGPGKVWVVKTGKDVATRICQ